MADKQILKLGVDIGSTTVKTVVLNDNGDILFSRYERHNSDVLSTIIKLLREIAAELPQERFAVAFAGSGALGVADAAGLPFVQEVIAATQAVKKYIPQTDVVIELGGEDGKITFFDKHSIDQRMNETCAGGTGAFIDQMAVLLQTDAAGLNELAKKHKTIYPIAARCGVFAKTDIMPLLNEGAEKADIAASIFQAVVDQTVGGLACGRKIKGKVAFLGGPLTFLSELKNRFIETLNLGKDDVVESENSKLFVALGAAINADTKENFTAEELLHKITEQKDKKHLAKISTLPPLFRSKQDYEDFKAAHKYPVGYADLESYKGVAFLGLDAGSTTTKAVLLDADKNILHAWYGENKGNPLASALEIVKEMYELLPADVYIGGAAVTGYGEGLIKAALGFDVGEVETIAHFRAAKHFVPDVSFILDIGGQDMKCIYIKNGTVDKIVLNEACSSGCGSFLSTFAESLHLSMEDFVRQALMAENPVDLGSRCTVFMNSKIKQAQKESASIGDISSGLAYSVVKNALYKVIKIASVEALGEKIVVQGGTFYNDAVLKALEHIVGRKVVRPDIAGLMGAFGAALLAMERAEDCQNSGLIKKENISDFKVKNMSAHCGKCSNHCLLTISVFPDGRKFITGNRCERGAGKSEEEISKAFNMFQYKYDRLFNYYKPLENAPLGEIGIPRVLNMYENYPLWFTLLTELGFKVVLSDASSRNMFNKGLDSITSQTVCFPAKIVHGHIINLVEKGVKSIFYPCVPLEEKEFKDANAHYNCPIVSSYPEVVRLNMDILREKRIRLHEPFMPLHSPKTMELRIAAEFSSFGLSKSKIHKAMKKAVAEEKRFRKEIRDMGAKIVKQVKDSGGKAIVLSGRPYHLDNLINHGIPSKITAEGVPVLSEDSVAHLGVGMAFPLRVIDQWTYHSRLYRAANFVAKNPEFELVQLNSFGCGLDAITTEQVEEILGASGKIYTLLKIDEGSNLGAVQIRIRSLLAGMRDKNRKQYFVKPKQAAEFTKEMSGYTILCPQMAPLQFKLFHEVMSPLGYNIQVLPDFDKSMVEEGLRYVNNDACYPAIVVVGQLISALKSGKYDLNKTALVISQTGGGCRATNYISFLKAAVLRAGFPDIPIIALNMSSLRTCGLKIDYKSFLRFAMAFAYGDLLMRLSNSTRPYEKVKGQTEDLINHCFNYIKQTFEKARYKDFVNNVNYIVQKFDEVEVKPKDKVKVGIVGEILVKFHPGANNNLVSLIEREGGEAVIPDFMDFINYVFSNGISNYKYLAGGLKTNIQARLMIWAIEKFFRNPMRKALKKSKNFCTFSTTKELSEKVKSMVSVCNQMGEGWLLTAEMIELIEEGVPNIICVQPFGCLPNHITGKGVIKALKTQYENANITAIDYDSGASEVNQLNRIKLMMASAKS